MDHLTLTPSPHHPHMQAGTVAANGLDFHFEIGGDPAGEPVLLIMGLGAQMLHWTENFCQGLIDAGFRVIRFDNRDIGLSGKFQGRYKRVHPLKLMGRFSLGLTTPHASGYTLEDMAEDTHQLLHALRLERVHVIGASMGGMIAQILAAKYPEQVRSLGLLFTSNNRALLPPPGLAQLRILTGKPRGHDEDSMAAHAVKLYQLIGSPGHIDPKQAEAFSRMLYRRSFYPAGVMRQYAAILASGPLTAYDRRIQAPTLVVHGSRDLLVRPSHGRAVARSIKGARFELIEGMGHDIPDHFAPRLVALFAQHFASTRN